MYGDALTTKERIKDRLGITVAIFDALLDNLILAVTARIEQMCGRRFILATYTHEVHDGSDVFGSCRTMLIVKNAPVQAITSVEYQAGTNLNPNWREYDQDVYQCNLEEGIIYFSSGLPNGMRNIRITYTGGFNGYSIGVNNYWLFNVVPAGAVDGANLTFTLPEVASQVVVYGDGMREITSNVSFTPGNNTFTLAAGRAPYTTISVDYKRVSAAEDSDLGLPAELVEVAEEAVTRLFKRRDSEGRTSETFQESSITWARSVFTAEDLATIKNYRRGYNL